MNNNISSYVVGVDVGGTFTDIFFLDETTGDCKVAKVQTTLNNQAEGFLAGILKNVDQVADITTVVHGTTVGTNALHERKGAKTGIITSEGFRDVLEMRRRDRPQTARKLGVCGGVFNLLYHVIYGLKLLSALWLTVLFKRLSIGKK